MAKDMEAKKAGKGAVVLPDKGSKGYKCGGEVKKLAAGGAAKTRKSFPMTKAMPAKKK